MEIPGTSNDLATSSQNCDDYSGSSLTTQQSIGLDGLANSHVSIVDVDPKYIVNEYCSRPVLPSDKETVSSKLDTSLQFCCLVGMLPLRK